MKKRDSSRRSVMGVLTGFTPDEERTLLLRFGIGNPEGLSEAEAEKFRVARERAREIQAKALAKIKKVQARTGKSAEEIREDARIRLEAERLCGKYKPLGPNATDEEFREAMREISARWHANHPGYLKQ